jgi:hypothetical protein
LGWRTEVPVIELPMGDLVDRRSWDAAVDGLDRAVRIEAETHVHDVQALERRIRLKQRDGRIDVVVLVLSDTRHHRRVIAAADAGLAELFPITTRAALRAFSEARSPRANAIVLV